MITLTLTFYHPALVRCFDSDSDFSTIGLSVRRWHWTDEAIVISHMSAWVAMLLLLRSRVVIDWKRAEVAATHCDCVVVTWAKKKGRKITVRKFSSKNTVISVIGVGSVMNCGPTTTWCGNARFSRSCAEIPHAFWGTFGAKLKLWAPVIFSGGNLQLSVGKKTEFSTRKLYLTHQVAEHEQSYRRRIVCQRSYTHQESDRLFTDKQITCLQQLSETTLELASKECLCIPLAVSDSCSIYCSFATSYSTYTVMLTMRHRRRHHCSVCWTWRIRLRSLKKENDVEKVRSKRRVKRRVC